MNPPEKIVPFAQSTRENSGSVAAQKMLGFNPWAIKRWQSYHGPDGNIQLQQTIHRYLSQPFKSVCERLIVQSFSGPLYLKIFFVATHSGVIQGNWRLRKSSDENTQKFILNRFQLMAAIDVNVEFMGYYFDWGRYWRYSFKFYCHHFSCFSFNNPTPSPPIYDGWSPASAITFINFNKNLHLSGFHGKW